LPSEKSGLTPVGRQLFVGYGGLAGFVIGFGSWLLLSEDETVIQGWMMISIALGGVLGRIIAWRTQTTL
jgi:hypothetical protein